MKTKKLFAILAATAMMSAASVMPAMAKTPDPADYPDALKVQEDLAPQGGTIFPIGGPNVKFDANFTGQTFHASLAKDSISVSNVTFTKGAHTFWHIHHGTCQILVPESGRGYYQIWGEEAHELKPGTVVTIPEGVKHWHGASQNSMMQHLSIMQAEGVSTEWLEPVDDNDYKKLK